MRGIIESQDKKFKFEYMMSFEKKCMLDPAGSLKIIIDTWLCEHSKIL